MNFLSTYKMPFEYKCVLIIGATSGIGEALAEKLVLNDAHVVISGRRQDKLDAFVEKYGSDRVKSKVFDVMRLDKVRLQW